MPAAARRRSPRRVHVRARWRARRATASRFRAHDQIRHRQFDRVFLEALDARKLRGRQERAVDAQMRVAARRGPLGEIGVHALAIDDQRRQHADVLAPGLAHHLRDDRVERLRRHRHVAVGAVLHAELHVDEPQEVIELGQRGHRRLPAAARGALLDRHRGRNAVDRVDVGSARGLHDRARVGVQRFEVAALTFVEQDVECQRRFAGARHAGDDGERVARNVDVDPLQVVLARIAHFDHIALRDDAARSSKSAAGAQCHRVGRGSLTRGAWLASAAR